jgi:hypothetical protein
MMVLPQLAMALPVSHTESFRLEQLLDQAGREHKQLMFEVMEQENEQSLLEHATFSKRYKGSINFYRLRRNSKLAKSLGVHSNDVKFLLMSPDKQMRMSLKTFDLLLLENAISIYVSTWNIRQQIEFLMHSAHIKKRDAEEQIAAYYARHDKLKSPESTPQYYLNIYTLERRYFPDFQKAYLRHWESTRLTDAALVRR